MPLTPAAQNQILNYIQIKLQTDQTWAETLSKLTTLDQPAQNGAIWSMLESINDSIRWDKSFAEHPEVLDRIIEKSRKSMEDRKRPNPTPAAA